jgi:hypothetical protein
MTDNEAKQKVDDAYHEAESGWNDWFLECEEDDRMYLGDQWSSSNKSKLLADRRPILSINKVKKVIDLTTGWERQNRTDIKYRPENKADTQLSDIYTELAKFVMTRRNSQYNVSYTFQDACIGGMGWVSPHVDYYEDALNGDMDVRFENKYRIMMDPYTTDPRLTDCSYMLRSAWLAKDNARELYPEIKKEIKRMEGINVSKFTNQFPASIRQRGERVQVIEMWERSYEKTTVLYDVMTDETRIWDGSKQKLKDIKELQPELFMNIITFERYMPKMHLITLVNDEIVVHKGPPPTTHSQTMYPFIPMIGYYQPNFNDWRWKLQGIVRVLKDPQRELNKTRSLQMEAQYSTPASGWVYRDGVLDDPAELNKVGPRQKIKLLEGALGDGLWQIPPVQIQPAFVQLEQQHKEDIRDSGPDTNLMGMAGPQGLSPDTSGVAIQMVQKKELMSLQNIFDGKSLMMRMLGKYMMEYFNKWSNQKIQSIIGKPLPQNWEQMKKRARMDVVIDEINNSPTYRMAGLATLQGFVQHGIKVPEQILREMADLPEEVRQMWAGIEKQQQQQAQQAQQQAMQLEQRKIDSVYKGELQKEQLKSQGDKELEVLEHRGDKELKEMDIMGKLAVENLKQQGKAAEWKKPKNPWGR